MPIPEQRQAPSHVVYTPRAIALGMTFVAVLLLVAVPMREYLSQRADIKKVESDRAAAQQRVNELNAERQSFDDPATIERLARERLHYTYPGETGVLLATPPKVEAPAAVKHGRAKVTKDNATWYSKLWSSTVDASK